jgi:hypothetical protein
MANTKEEHSGHKGSSHAPPARERGARGTVPEEGPQPLVRTETLPVSARIPKGEPVGHARHAETKEEAEKILDVERAKIPPPGSRNYVAGQPVNEEEAAETEAEAARLAEAGRAQRTEAEKRIAENNPEDPDYHPVDPDHPDPGKRRG